MFSHGYVLLGLDDSEHDEALHWAAREARSLRTDLRIVRAIHWSTHLAPWDSIDDCAISAGYRGAVETLLRQTIGQMHELYPDVVAHCEAVDAYPSRALLDRSRDAVLTVVGAHKLHATDGTALGPVSALIAAQAPGPVVLVGGTSDPSTNPAVVVGVDDSPVTDDVLSFAFDYAHRHGRPLRALVCWPVDPLAEAQSRPAPQPSERAQQWLADTLGAWSEKYPDVEVRRTVLRNRPVAGLINASLGQDLLVVGGHSRQARPSALLGSVTQGVVHHAGCPVAVVR